MRFYFLSNLEWCKSGTFLQILITVKTQPVFIWDANYLSFVHSVTKPNLTRAKSQTSANSARAHFQVATAAATTTTVVVVVTAATAATVEAAAAATTTLDTATTETTVSGPFSFGHAPSHLTPSGHDSSLCFTVSLATDLNFAEKKHKMSGPVFGRTVPRIRINLVGAMELGLILKLIGCSLLQTTAMAIVMMEAMDAVAPVVKVLHHMILLQMVSPPISLPNSRTVRSVPITHTNA